MLKELIHIYISWAVKSFREVFIRLDVTTVSLLGGGRLSPRGQGCRGVRQHPEPVFTA